METKFKMLDDVISIWEPNIVGTIVKIDTKHFNEPVYTILYEDGNMYAGYAENFRKANKI